MTSPIPTLDQMFPLDFILGCTAILVAVFVVPTLYWAWSEHRDSVKRSRRW